MAIYPFIEERFSENISYGATGGPGFSTEVFTSSSGAEQRNVLWSKAKCKYDVTHGIRDKADMDEIIAFFRIVHGKATGFRYKDWSDFELIDGLIGTGDGTTKDFQIVKRYSFGSQDDYVRELKKIVQSTVTGVTVGVAAQTEGTDFTIDYNNGRIIFNSPPGIGEDIRIGALEFDVPVRFDTDDMAISLEAFELESWTGIPLVELKL